MLTEARGNCANAGVSKVDFVMSDDALTAHTDPFDLIHSYIVLQHIPVECGLAPTDRMLSILNPRRRRRFALFDQAESFAGAIWSTFRRLTWLRQPNGASIAALLARSKRPRRVLSSNWRPAKVQARARTSAL
jgi:hypothetical protein